MANVTDLQTKYSKLAQEYSKVTTLYYGCSCYIDGLISAVIDVHAIVDEEEQDSYSNVC